MSGLLSSYFSNWKYSNKLASFIKLERVNTKIRMNYASKVLLSELTSHGMYFRCFSTLLQSLHFNISIAEEKYQPFKEILNLRRLEAKRSILVQVQSSHSFKELHRYCNSIGTVKKMFHYSTGIEPMVNKIFASMAVLIL